MHQNNDTILAKYQDDADSNWGRLIVLTKKYFDQWALQTIRPQWNQMKLSYMPLISNIRLNGSTSNEIAKRSLTAKQSMSVTLKELEKEGMVVATMAKKDKRSHKISLTEKGKEFMLVANQELSSLTNEYIMLVGKSDFETTIRVLQTINQYHEKLNNERSKEEI